MSADNVLMYDIISQNVVLKSNKILDLSSGILRISKSQKQSIFDGINSDIDWNNNNIKASELIGSELVLPSSSKTNHNILYAKKDGTLMSADNVLMYDIISQNVVLKSNKILDLSSGILRISKSQKQSIF